MLHNPFVQRPAVSCPKQCKGTMLNRPAKLVPLVDLRSDYEAVQRAFDRVECTPELLEFWRGCVRNQTGKWSRKFVLENFPRALFVQELLNLLRDSPQAEPDFSNPLEYDYLCKCAKTRLEFLKDYEVYSGKPFSEFEEWFVNLHSSQVYLGKSDVFESWRASRLFGKRVAKIQEELRVLCGLPPDAGLYRHIIQIVRVYEAGMSPTFTFATVNNSFFMNIVNALLQQRGVLPVEHGILDFLVIGTKLTLGRDGLNALGTYMFHSLFYSEVLRFNQDRLCCAGKIEY